MKTWEIILVTVTQIKESYLKKVPAMWANIQPTRMYKLADKSRDSQGWNNWFYPWVFWVLKTKKIYLVDPQAAITPFQIQSKYKTYLMVWSHFVPPKSLSNLLTF